MVYVESRGNGMKPVHELFKQTPLPGPSRPWPPHLAQQGRGQEIHDIVAASQLSMGFRYVC